jgi:Flp pilus assembly pilin Flp
MLKHLRDNPLIAVTLAFVRTRVEPLRERTERGASAIEWAVIAAICVVAALAIGTAVMAVINNNKTTIGTGSNLPK